MQETLSFLDEESAREQQQRAQQASMRAAPTPQPPLTAADEGEEVHFSVGGRLLGGGLLGGGRLFRRKSTF